MCKLTKFMELRECYWLVTFHMEFRHKTDLHTTFMSAKLMGIHWSDIMTQLHIIEFEKLKSDYKLVEATQKEMVMEKYEKDGDMFRVYKYTVVEKSTKEKGKLTCSFNIPIHGKDLFEIQKRANERMMKFYSSDLYESARVEMVKTEEPELDLAEELALHPSEKADPPRIFMCGPGARITPIDNLKIEGEIDDDDYEDEVLPGIPMSSLPLILNYKKTREHLPTVVTS